MTGGGMASFVEGTRGCHGEEKAGRFEGKGA